MRVDSKIFQEKAGSRSVIEKYHTSFMIMIYIRRIQYISPKNTFQKGHFPEKHLAEWTLSRMYISLNVHFPECTFGRMDISPKTFFPEWTLAVMYIWPNGHFPENLFSRMDTFQNVLNIFFVTR